jgi:hypothetical protein
MARGWESKSVEEQQAAAIAQAESKQRLSLNKLPGSSRKRRFTCPAVASCSSFIRCKILAIAKC